MSRDEFQSLKQLARRWLDEAAEHEDAAAEVDDEERDMHVEAARVYKKCAGELLEVLK